MSRIGREPRNPPPPPAAVRRPEVRPFGLPPERCTCCPVHGFEAVKAAWVERWWASSYYPEQYDVIPPAPSQPPHETGR